MSVKTCNGCGQILPLDAFYANKRRKNPNSRQQPCKDCQTRRSLERYHADPELRRKIADRNRRMAQNRTPEQRRRNNIRYRFKISVAEYDALVASANGVCQICGEPPRAITKFKYGEVAHCLHVDHDHATGRIRGMICPRCNGLLGMALDQPARLRAAADYLDGGSGNPDVQTGDGRHELLTRDDLVPVLEIEDAKTLQVPTPVPEPKPVVSQLTPAQVACRHPWPSRNGRVCNACNYRFPKAT